MADATAHRKIVGYAASAVPVFEKAGMADGIDEGFVLIGKPADCETFVAACRKLRFWDRAAAER